METIVAAADPLDAVDRVLASVRVRSSVYCRSELGAPWGFRVEAHGNPSFHIVTRGACWLDVDGEDEPLRLRRGDLVLLPHGPRHAMRDAPGSPAPLLDDILAAAPPNTGGRLRYGGGGARTELVCGGFVLEAGEADLLLRGLPSVLRLAGDGRAPPPWVAATLELLATVADGDAPGTTAVVDKLADAMLTQALRLALAELAADDPARLRALRDPPIARALRLIHDEPERRWTLEALAREVGYSRSAFATRFRQLVGEPPTAYLARVRLARAASLLERTDLTLADVARRSGYASEFSFSRAFKRMFGVAPGGYRASPVMR